MQWSELRGDVRERFCEKCQRTVVNLSVLTPAQRGAILARARTERVCVAYRQYLTDGRDEPAAPTVRGAVNTGTLVKIGGTAALLAAVAALGTHVTRDPAAAEHTWENAQELYHTARYTVEEWIDDVRVFFGGTPRHTFVLGMVCEPPPPAPPPASPPASP